AEVVGLHHGVVVQQAGQLEVQLGLGVAAFRDGDVVVGQVLAEGLAARLVVVEVVEHQALALGQAEHAVDARHDLVAAEVEALGEAVRLVHVGGRGRQGGLGGGAHGTQAQGEAVFAGILGGGLAGAGQQGDGKQGGGGAQLHRSVAYGG